MAKNGCVDIETLRKELVVEPRNSVSDDLCEALKLSEALLPKRPGIIRRALLIGEKAVVGSPYKVPQRAGCPLTLGYSCHSNEAYSDVNYMDLVEQQLEEPLFTYNHSELIRGAGEISIKLAAVTGSAFVLFEAMRAAIS